jgi:glycosyltransferase involved in cell wall biosynthesis
MKTFAQRRGRIERIRNFLWVAGLKRSRKIIAISQATQRDLLETFDLPDGKVVVIYEGYDPDIFRPASEIGSAAPYLLYAGTLAPNKNIPFLLRAFARARGSSPIRLKLVGKQSTADVEALLQPLSEEVRSAIDFVGFVSDEELAALMQQCTAFVFPSLNEGFGLAVVEAMACGAPIISSDAGSLLEVVGDGGVLLSPTDEEKWVAQIAAVLGDPDIRHQLRSRALARSAAFSWSNAASAYLSLLRTTRLEKR